LKRSVLKSDLKAVKVTVLLVEDGSRFHRAGTAVENEFLQKFEGAMRLIARDRVAWSVGHYSEPWKSG